MGIGIQICGLNGCGKSTIGKALAQKIGFHFIDNEDLFFSRTNANEPYANARSHEAVERLLMDEVREYGDFVFSAVRGNYGDEIIPLYSYVVLVEVPREIRLQRVRNRSFQKFGERMLPGGDLFESEESFFQLVASRTEDYSKNWAQSLNCPIIRIDGTKPIDENVELIIRTIGI